MHLKERFIARFPAILTHTGMPKRIIILLLLGHLTCACAWAIFPFKGPTLYTLLAAFFFYILLRFFVKELFAHVVARLLLSRIILGTIVILSYGLIGGHQEVVLGKNFDTTPWNIAAYALAVLSVYDMYWCYKGFPGFMPLKVVHFYMNLRKRYRNASK